MTAVLTAACGNGAKNAASGGDASDAASEDAPVNDAAGAGDGSVDTGPPDTMTRVYAADDPNIQYTGRIDFTNPKVPNYSVGGVYMTARFMGTAVSVSLKDEFRYGTYRNYYDAILDGTFVTQITPQQGLSDAGTLIVDYPIAAGLPYGEHVVTIVKRTEANVGKGFFLGFTFAGRIQPPPTAPARKVEFIGDSITAGFGVDAPNGDPACQADGMGQPTEDVYKAFGPVLARTLNADSHVIGISGIGLVLNYSQMYDARTMPEVYDLFYPEIVTPDGGTPVNWDPTKFTPDAIVIALGTNDFSHGDTMRPLVDTTAFANAYVDFIHKLRGYYTNAEIFFISSPVLGDSAAETPAGNLKSALATVESSLTAAGDTKVHKFYVTQISGNGCTTHPDAKQQAATAQELGAYIRSVMQW